MIKVSLINEIMIFDELQIDDSFFTTDLQFIIDILNSPKNIYNIDIYNYDRMISIATKFRPSLNAQYTVNGAYEIHYIKPTAHILNHMCMIPNDELRKAIKIYCLRNTSLFSSYDYPMLAAVIIGNNN